VGQGRRFLPYFQSFDEYHDFEYAMVDGTIVRVHRHGQGAKRGVESQAIGKSSGGINCKILALTDALGNLVDFRLMPGQAHDLRETALLIRDLQCDSFLGDRAFDADWLRQMLKKKGITPIIPPKSNREYPADFD
tara:strand:- start:4825 stop:5229 length:405 start_codon:yes stop_codon:yes gene_type:complete